MVRQETQIEQQRIGRIGREIGNERAGTEGYEEVRGEIKEWGGWKGK